MLSAVASCTLHVMQARQEYRRGDRVIARTPRGLEAGEVLCEADERVVSQMNGGEQGAPQAVRSKGR